MHEAIHSPQAPAAVGPYSQAVRAGSFLFCSGQIPISPSTGELISGDVAAQTRRCLENLILLLNDQGLTLADVVKTTVFLTDLTAFVAMNEIYASYFEAPYPARSTIQVAALPKGAAVEVEAIVALNKIA